MLIKPKQFWSKALDSGGSNEDISLVIDGNLPEIEITVNLPSADPSHRMTIEGSLKLIWVVNPNETSCGI